MDVNLMFHFKGRKMKGIRERAAEEIWTQEEETN
jgi:hypothetical protein